MKLEDQVCSLGLAKRLKELGIKQLSLFAWFSYGNGKGFILSYDDIEDKLPQEYISAFTVAELGEMLPEVLYPKTASGSEKNLIMYKTDGAFYIGYRNSDNQSMVYFTTGLTEVNARATMLILLIENGLHEVNK